VTTDFRSQVEAERPYLLRFALLQLRNREQAEDAVQDALVAALAGEASFGARSNLRTWLTGILKHKIVDSIRRSGRERPLESAEREGEPEEFDTAFDERGHWREGLAAWQEPYGALHEKQFVAALESCLAALPARTARVFLMREHMGMDTDEICKELDLTPTHCWVLLYRARMALRRCLAQNWFAK